MRKAIKRWMYNYLAEAVEYVLIKVRCVHLCSVSSHLGAVDEGEECMSRVGVG